MQELAEARELVETLKLLGRNQLRSARSLLQVASAADRRLARLERRLAVVAEPPQEAEPHEHDRTAVPV